MYIIACPKRVDEARTFVESTSAESGLFYYTQESERARRYHTIEDAALAIYLRNLRYGPELGYKMFLIYKQQEITPSYEYVLQGCTPNKEDRFYGK